MSCSTWWQIGARPRQGEPERRTLVRLWLDPDTFAVDLDDALDQCQADAGAVALLIELIEQTEDVLVVSGRDSDPVVADVAKDLVAVLAGADLDPRPLCRPSGRRLASAAAAA